MSDASGVSIESLRRLAQGLLHDPHRAEDVVQEAWLAALRRDVEARSLGAWLHGAVRRIARGKVREEQRRRARERHAARDEVVAGGADVAARIEVLRKLLDAVEKLDDPSRTVISMRFFDDLPPREIARRLDVPVDTVRTRIRRALATLRRELDPRDADARERFLCALAPLAGLPVATAPIVSTATTLELATPVFFMKNKLALVTVIVAALCAITVTIGLLPRKGAEEATQPVVETAAVETRTSETPHVAHVETEAASRTVATSIAAPRDWIVRGFVVRDTYEPVPGAELVGRVRAGTHTSGEILLEETFVADEHGEFAWALAAPSQALHLVVEAVGSGAHLRGYPRNVFPGDAPPENWRIHLVATDCSVRGLVRDESGNPVAGARVNHSNHGPEAFTKANGAFRMLTAAAWQETPVTIRADGFAPARVSLGLMNAGDLELDDIVLRPELRIRGSVVDELGHPIVGAAVRASSAEPFSTTDVAGRFELGGLDAQPESTWLIAMREGYVRTWLSLTKALASDEPIELRMPRAVTLEGTVRSVEGRPVEGAWITFQPGELSLGGERRGVRSGPDGRFMLEGSSPGPQQLFVERTGFVRDMHSIDVPDGVDAVSGVELVLERGGFLGGIVVDEQGAPLPFASVSVEVSRPLAGRILSVHTYTGRDGRFHVEALPRTKSRIVVNARDHARFEQGVDEIDRVDLVLRPSRAAAIAGRVLDNDTGLPITSFVLKVDSFAHLTPVPRSWVDGIAIREAWDGTWRLSGAFEAGHPLRVAVHAAGYAPMIVDSVQTSIEPDPGALVVRLMRDTHIRGVVVDEEGVPLGGIRVQSFRDPGELQWRDPGVKEIETDSLGRFEFRNVPSGETRLAADSTEHAIHVDGPFDVTGGTIAQRHIVLERGASLRGRLLDDRGKSLAGEIVSAYGLEVVGEEREWETITGEDGSYVLDRLPAGLYHVRWARVLGEERCYDLVERIRLRANETRAFDIEPKGHATVRGRIEWAGELPETARVLVLPEYEPSEDDGSGPLRYARSARAAFIQNGHFDLRGMPAGVHTALAQIAFASGSLVPALHGSVKFEVPASGIAYVVLVLVAPR